MIDAPPDFSPSSSHDPFVLVGGTVHDPTHGHDGTVANIWIESGRIVCPPSDTTRFRYVDVTGLVVMPGGIDLHSHVAGPKVNTGRCMSPQLGTHCRGHNQPSAVPTIHATGSLYASLGYTTVFDAAIPTSAASLAEIELADLPILDKGFYLLAAENTELLDALETGHRNVVQQCIASIVRNGSGWGVKVANPGGAAFWKDSRGNHHDLDTKLPGRALSSREILERLAAGVQDASLPHPLHIHTSHLGLPGNWRTLYETMQTLSGIPAHLAHVQFHSYTGGDLDPDSFGSGVSHLLDSFHENKNLTLDVGQILFGETVAMTGDPEKAEHLAYTTGVPWSAHDLWLEGGCGVLPIEYKEKNLIHSWQWAIGLEWFLSVDDPWRVVLSTDHPNGAHFTAYPILMQLLGDESFRRDAFRRIHPAVQKRSPLASISREYSIQELCIITRAAPAKIAGLPQKGHLGVGADADITVYRPNQQLAEMFAMPAAVYKSGILVNENGHCRCLSPGQHLRAVREL